MGSACFNRYVWAIPGLDTIFWILYSFDPRFAFLSSFRSQQISVGFNNCIPILFSLSWVQLVSIEMFETFPNSRQFFEIFMLLCLLKVQNIYLYIFLKTSRIKSLSDPFQSQESYFELYRSLLDGFPLEPKRAHSISTGILEHRVDSNKIYINRWSISGLSIEPRPFKKFLWNLLILERAKIICSTIRWVQKSINIFFI